MSSEPKKFDTVVIGAGPGGYVCAIRLTQLGKSTAIVERDYVGGVCLNVGCIPSKALIYASSMYWKIKHEMGLMGIQTPEASYDLKKMQSWKSGVVKKLTQGVSQLLSANGVELIKGMATFKDFGTIEVKGAAGSALVSARNFVISTGSRVIDLPLLAINGKNIISSTEALELTCLPRKLLVIGGGFIGLELGIVYAKLGSQVTIVEATDQILPDTDRELVACAEKKMKKLGMSVLLNSKALGVKEKDPLKSSTLYLDIETLGKSALTLEADIILVSVGRKPNSDGMGLETLGIALDPKRNIIINTYGQTNVRGIYAIGDVTGAPQLAHRASMDGLLVAAVIAGEKSYKDYRTVPWAVFCDPEIASCGLSEKQIQEKGIPYRVGRFPFAASGRALCTNETEGFIKVLIGEKDESILGVHIAGPEASNLIAIACLAIEMGACAEDVIRTIHIHPTLPEVFPEALEAAYSKAIHLRPARPK